MEAATHASGEAVEAAEARAAAAESRAAEDWCTLSKQSEAAESRAFAAECAAEDAAAVAAAADAEHTACAAAAAARQGPTLVHFSAQLQRFLWDRGCILGLFRVYQGVSGVSKGRSGMILSHKRLRLS